MDNEHKELFKAPLKVLIVDDNQVDCALVEKMLSESSQNISFLKSAHTLAGALDLLKKNDFDIVVLDLNLPDGKGKKTLVELNQKFPEVAVVVNTGAYEVDWGLQLLSCGAQDFLIKGKFDAYILSKVMRYSLERKRLESELKKACEKLKETQNQLIQSEKMKVVGGLASGVAHEVKNPLATILYGITYLNNQLQKKDKKVETVLENIREATDRANDIITDLLDFSSVNSLEKRKENINSVVEKSISLVNHECDKNHVQVIKKFNEDIPEVEIDRNKIEQVLINLMLNAIYAMSDGGKIELKTDCQKLSKDIKKILDSQGNGFKAGERVVVVHVDDIGCGIPEEKMQKIFDPFFTTRRGNGGVGLGLSVSQNIMEGHGGLIFIESKKEGGTRATLIFRAGS